MSASILIVDDEENARHNIGAFLKGKGYEVFGVATLAEARERIRLGNADIILLDVQLPDGYGPSLLEEMMYVPNRPPIILITAFGEIDMAVEAMKNGAYDFLQKPIELANLQQSIERAEESVALRRELAHLRKAQHQNLDFIVGKTEAMKNLINLAYRAATGQVTILLSGETGTGKEILAKAIHQMGPRKDKPFIPINCAALQPSMLESELFGHEAGAFTSAEKRKLGLMEVADGGILFLDEVSSMDLGVQAKLLRALDTKSFFRVGGTNEIKVDVQLVAGSNRDLEQLIEEEKFRRDLLYRLKVAHLELPPLRERVEDIPDLVGLFIRQINQRMGANITDLAPKALEALMAYPWPGNIRELRNVIERSMLLCDDQVIDLSHLPMEIAQTPMLA